MKKLFFHWDSKKQFFHIHPASILRVRRSPCFYNDFPLGEFFTFDKNPQSPKITRNCRFSRQKNEQYLCQWPNLCKRSASWGVETRKIERDPGQFGDSKSAPGTPAPKSSKQKRREAQISKFPMIGQHALTQFWLKQVGGFEVRRNRKTVEAGTGPSSNRLPIKRFQAAFILC
ncbi:MAG TPA: hypothetical protein PKV71_01775 [Calditrichia bacterium]|nr:hypothetical protein [Calditrichia bacterium]